MINNNNIRQADQAASLIREQMETIRINILVLEKLKANGRISDSDANYNEIKGLHTIIQKSYNEFLWTELPGFIEMKQDPGKEVLKKSFIDWAADLHGSLNHLDYVIKEFMDQIIVEDQSLAPSVNTREIKDKRFWNYLDRIKEPTRLFESFEGPDDPDESDQPLDAEP